MTDNVKVNPSLNNNAVNVATDDINNVHYPIYKHAFGKDGEATLVDKDNPIPVTTGIDDLDRRIEEFSMMGEVLGQLKIMNRHLSMISGSIIGEDDTHE